MARRSKSDNAALGILYLIGLPFILVYGVFCSVIWIIGKILQFCFEKTDKQNIEMKHREMRSVK